MWLPLLRATVLANFLGTHGAMFLLNLAHKKTLNKSWHYAWVKNICQQKNMRKITYSSFGTLTQGNLGIVDCLFQNRLCRLKHKP